MILGIIVVTAGLGGAGYYYAFQQLTTRSQVLATNEAAQKVAEAQLGDLGTLQHKYNAEVVPVLPLMDQALPRDKKQTEILAQIEHIAGNVGVPITGVTMPSPVGLPSSVSQTTKAGVVLALPISFQVVGSYAQLQTFTTTLESLNRFTNITNLAISRDSATGQATYTYSLNAYIAP